MKKLLTICLMLLGAVAQAQNFAITATTEAAIRKNIVKGNAANYGFGMINDTLKLVGLTTRNVIFTGSTSKNDIGLSNVDNTSDLNKPVSTATQTALNLKQNQLNGTGFVKATGTTISYDNSTYLSTSTAASTYLPISNPTSTGTLTAPTIANSLGANFATTSGNVGVGTASPTMKLDVNGGARFGTTYVSPSYTNSINTGYGADVDGQELYFNYVGYNDGFTRFRNTSIANGKASSILYAVGSTGRVGIGTTTPLRSLDVTDAIRSTSNFAGFEAVPSTGTAYRWILNNDNNYLLQSSSDKFVANAAIRLSLFDGGNIGIGTSTNLGYKLDVNGQTNTSDLRVVNSASIIGYNPLIFFNNGVQDIWSKGASGQIRIVDNAYSNVNFSLNQAGDGYFRGNVGIGTSTPSAKLEISGAGVVSSQITSTNSTAQLVTSGTLGQIYNTTGDLYLTNASTTNSTLFVNNGAERMRIFSNGRVGIGTPTDEGFLLNVNGTAKVNGDLSMRGVYPILTLFGSQSGSLNIRLQNYITGVSNTGFEIYDQTNTASRLAITGTGNIGIGTTAPNAKLDVAGNVFASGNNPVISGTTGVGIGTSGGYPQISLRDNAGATDTKTWDTYAAGTIMYSRVINDSNNSAQVWQQVQRSGTTVSSVSFPNGNVGIGTTTPNASSILDITSTTKGVLFPRLTTTQISAIASPADGLTVYNTTLKAICFYDAGAAVWKRVSHSNM